MESRYVRAVFHVADYVYVHVTRAYGARASQTGSHLRKSQRQMQIGACERARTRLDDDKGQAGLMQTFMSEEHKKLAE